ncbi:glycosyltransferase family 4 protein [bacterium]|nr:glycosyltransferase family 4 protein [bacterium]
MHVAINALCINNRSGTGRYAHGLIDGLMRTQTGDARISVLVPSEFSIPPDWRNNEAISFYSIPTGGALQRVYFEQFQLPAWLKKVNPDLLHSPAFIAPIDAPKTVRQVVSIHDLAFIRYPETIPAMRLAYYRWAIPRSIQCAAQILTDAQSVSELITQEFSPNAPVNAIPLGVDARVFHQEKNDDDFDVLKQYGVASPYVLFVGTQEPRKNLPMLLGAYQTARGRGLSANLVLAGRYGWKQQEALLNQEGVLRIGFVNDEHLPALYRHAQAFAAPSLDEGFNLPSVEALACGTRVIASDIAVHREILGEHATYAAPDHIEQWEDALLRIGGGLRTHPTIDAKMRARPETERRQLVHLRDWTDVAKETLEVYKNALGT